MTSRTKEVTDVADMSAPAGDDLAVVVCAYTEKRWDDIVAAIESLRNQTVTAGEIVLVIDHNGALLDRTRKHFDGSEGQAINIVANTHKRGLSGARNTGIEASRRSIIGFLDDDAVADLHWVEALLQPYADAQVVGVGGDIRPVWLAGRPKWFPEEFDWVVGCIYKGHAPVTTEVRNPIGANMSVLRSAFEEVGGFNSGLGRVGRHPVGAEETELYIRIKHIRPYSKVMYEPSAAVDHKIPANRGTLSYFLRRCYAEGLSKAIVSKISHSDENLSSEWDYTLRALPLGVLTGLRDGLKGDIHGLLRALAIVSGLATTTAGYVRGRAANGPERNPSLHAVLAPILRRTPSGASPGFSTNSAARPRLRRSNARRYPGRRLFGRGRQQSRDQSSSYLCTGKEG